MKKFFILTVLLVSFIVCSCEEPDSKKAYTSDIKVSNNCSWPIRANISYSKSNSTWVDIQPNSVHVFSGLEDDNYYLHVTALHETAPTKARENFFLSIRIFVNDTWSVTWDSGNTSYSVAYRISQAPVNPADPLEKDSAML